MTEQATEQQQTSSPYYMGGRGQDAEFLKYLLDNRDPIIELQYELEGKEIQLEGDRAILVQVRPPLVNPALRNKIFGFVKNYSSKSFRTTKFDEQTIGYMVYDVVESVIDMLELADRYHPQNWKADIQYLSSSPAFMFGSEQQILLFVEHNTRAGLNSSQGGMTLNKVTGMHTSIEQHNPEMQAQKKSVFGGMFRK